MWAAHSYENIGDLATARATAARALELCDDAFGPWMRAILSATMAGLAFQAGDIVSADVYARAALPVLEQLGAVEDYAQIRASLAMLALHSGQLDEETVRQELEGNICRCTGYHNIVKAVLDAAGRMKVAQAAE